MNKLIFIGEGCKRMNFKYYVRIVLLLPTIFIVFINLIEGIVNIYISNTFAKLFSLAIQKDMEVFICNVVTFLLIYLIIISGKLFFSLLIEFFKENRIIELKKKLFMLFLNNKYSLIEKYGQGEILNRLEQDFNDIVKCFYVHYSSVFSALICLAGYFIFLGLKNFSLSVIFFGLWILPIFPLFFTIKYMNKIVEESHRADDELTGFIKQSFEGIEVIKAYNLYEWASLRFLSLEEVSKKCANEMEKVGTIEDILYNLCNNIAKFGTYIMLGLFLYKKLITPDLVVVFISLFPIVIDNFKVAAKGFQNLRVEKSSFERISEILNFDIEDQYGNMIQINEIENIVFKNVSFSYENSKSIFNKLNFRINKGDKILIMGSNGSGKTTLLKLIMGLYESFKGDILINGVPLSKVDFKSFSKHISFIPQNFTFFTQDIDNNLNMMIQDNLEDRKRSLLHLFGLDDILSKKINQLSDGQKQKISIIRGLLKKSSILIIDEPTNYLDTKSIEILKDILCKSEKTIIIVSHNIELASCVNKIWRIENQSVNEIAEIY